MTTDRTYILEAQLAEGGLVIADRGTGKSSALAHLGARYMTEGKCHVSFIVPNYHMAERFEDRFRQLYPNLEVPTIIATERDFDRLYTPGTMIFVDELFLGWYKGGFFAAIGTPNFKIHFSSSVGGD